MSSAAADYLLKLTTDAQARADHQADPVGAMSSAGLSQEDQKALLSRDPQVIKNHLGDDAPPGCMIVVF
ncbi:MAG TPA: hypothetical protein PK413_06190 [Thermoanaerobaculia bacterium]|nr:hypothetical protein [Thermoanaerobaculia bacterium]